MVRFVRICLMSGLLLIGGVALNGCVVVPARGHPARAWVSGHWVAPHVWVHGHWRYH